MSDYLICYDISDEKRLARLAKVLEREALRIQKSIFLLINPSSKTFDTLIHEMQTLIDIQKDDLRLYRIKYYGIHLGCAIDLQEPFIVL